MVRQGNPAGPRPCVGRTWRALQADVYATETHCRHCGELVNIGLRLVNPRHPQAPSVDHVVAQRWRPDLALVRSNLRLAHFGCNSARGDGVTRKQPDQPRSRRW